MRPTADRAGRDLNVDSGQPEGPGLGAPRGRRTFFAGTAGQAVRHVQAMATAWATNAGPTVNCLKPFLIPDMWYESDKTDAGREQQQLHGAGRDRERQQGHGGEQWFYQPADAYGGIPGTITPRSTRRSPARPKPQTGYGSNCARASPATSGLTILFKPQTGNNQRQGNSYFTLDGAEAEPARGHQAADASTPASATLPNWSQGSATGQAKQGIDYLIDQDPSATWNPSTKQIENSAFPALPEPAGHHRRADATRSTSRATAQNVKPDAGAKFSNFARIFLENPPARTPITLRASFSASRRAAAAASSPGRWCAELQLIE